MPPHSVTLCGGFFMPCIKCAYTPRKSAAHASGFIVAVYPLVQQGIVAKDAPCAAAAVFTKNAVKAAPVLLSQKHAAGGKARGLAIMKQVMA